MAILTRGERFKDARTTHNQHGKQTMKAVETATGVSASLIKDLEDDCSTRSVGYDKVAVLAKHYGVSSDWLLGLTNDRNKTPAAVDDLGLSQTIIQEILYAKEHPGGIKTNRSSTIDSKSTHDIINALLETMFDTSIFISISVLTNNINKVKDITIPENITLDYDNFEIPVNEHERKELSIAAILLREIYKAHPEFYGLYQITTASEHFRMQIDDICDIFRHCVEKATGYSEYITKER